MEPCHTEVCKSTYTDGAISNDESNKIEVSNKEQNNNCVIKVNRIYARDMFLHYFVNDEQQVLEESFTPENQEHAFLDDEYRISEDLLLDSIRMPVSECIDIVSAAEHVGTFDNENSSPSMTHEQYTDLTGLMKISCSDCELDNSDGAKCQGELSLQCLKCNEIFDHRFWAIRHLDFCQSSSDDRRDRSLEPPGFVCDLCETKFQRIDYLAIHLQYCSVKDPASQHSEEHKNLEEIEGFVNYLSNASQVLKETMKTFGYQWLYAHFCTSCLGSIVDEASANPVKCKKCNAMSLLQCHTCKCLHETHESIIDHLKSSFCGYETQCLIDSSFRLPKQQNPDLLADAQQWENCEKRIQKKKSNKTSIKTMTVTVHCPYCAKSEKSQKGLTHCRICASRLVYRCDKCDADLPTLKALDLHQKSHLFKNYNKCSKCCRAFSQKNNLKMHETVCAQSPTTGDDPIPKEREQINIAVA